MLPNDFAVILENIIPPSQFRLNPVGHKKVFEMLFEHKGDRVFDVRVLNLNGIRLMHSQQCFDFFRIIGNVTNSANRPC